MATRGYLEWRYHGARRRIIRAFCSKLYRDSHRDTGRSIMVAGTARSGTTWVTDLIASQISCRVLFEPFHSKLVEAFQQFHYFQYMRPDEQNQELLAYCRRVFSGDIRDRWIDHEVETIFPQYRLVKDIRANLFLGWLHNHFPEVPLLFVIRHPCAVVLSRMQLGWWTDKDIEPFLSQPKLVDDFLAEKMKVLGRAKTDEEKHAIIWCISNLVPIRQFHSHQLDTIFYENLCTQPEQEIPRIFQAIEHDYDDAIFASAQQPSYTTVRTSAIVTGKDKVTRWKRELSPQQISNVLSVVADFELDYIYADSVTPLITDVSSVSLESQDDARGSKCTASALG
jgi:hypothetical protein